MMGSAVMMGVPASKGFSVLLRVLNKRTQIMDGKPVPSIFSLRNHIFRMETNKERNKPRKMVKIQCKNPSCHVLPSYRVLFHSNLRNPFNRWTNQRTDMVACTRPKKGKWWLGRKNRTKFFYKLENSLRPTHKPMDQQTRLIQSWWLDFVMVEFHRDGCITSGQMYSVMMVILTIFAWNVSFSFLKERGRT